MSDKTRSCWRHGSFAPYRMALPRVEHRSSATLRSYTVVYSIRPCTTCDIIPLEYISAVAMTLAHSTAMLIIPNQIEWRETGEEGAGLGLFGQWLSLSLSMSVSVSVHLDLCNDPSM